MADLTSEEIEKVRKVLRYADEIEQQMEYRLAQRLVVRTWRSVIIGLAGIIGGYYVIRDWIGKLLAGAGGQ